MNFFQRRLRWISKGGVIWFSFSFSFSFWFLVTLYKWWLQTTKYLAKKFALLDDACHTILLFLSVTPFLKPQSQPSFVSILKMQKPDDLVVPRHEGPSPSFLICFILKLTYFSSNRSCSTYLRINARKNRASYSLQEQQVWLRSFIDVVYGWGAKIQISVL